MANAGVTSNPVEAEHQQYDGAWGWLWAALAICSLVLILAGIASMICYMEKRRCNPDDCEKCGIVRESIDIDTGDETPNNATALSQQR